MKNTKKNTGTNPDISMHTQIISQRITQKINEIGRKTHALKKKEEKNTFRIFRLVFLFIIIKYIYEKKKKRIRKKINKNKYEKENGKR